MGSGQSTSAAPLQEITRFKVGDRVAVTMDVENFRLLQNDYGGWEAQMSLIFGNVGIVQKLLPSGGLMVHYKVANATWQLNPTAVEKLIAYKRGDKVRVCVNLETLKEFQKGHGGYNERMQTSIGKVGVVVRCEPNFDVSVRICGAVWNYNPLCLEAAPKSSIDSSGSSSSTDSIESSGDGTDILTDRIGGLLRLAERVDELAQMVQRRSLEESPLHAACYHGDEELARTLIHAGNNVNARDKDGDTPLHYCAYGNEPGAMRLLVTAGADLNAVNEKNRTPLHIAASKEHADCVRTLLSYGSRIKVNLQDVAGDTALHDAITVGSAEIASLLINFRTMDLSITNQRGFNTLHHACLKGNNLIVERILSKRPNLLNVAKNDGFTALHLAANNGHLRVAKTLLAKRQCDINAHASKGETPLMLAAFFGHWDILELLVESGADINRQDQDGDTVLHFSIARHQLRKLQTSGTANAPNVSAIERELPNGRLAPLCYLANRGADVYMMNNKGITPLMLAAGFDISEHVVAWASRSRFLALESSRALRQSSASPLGGGLCKICMESEANVVFKPCGHRTACRECCMRCKVCLTCAGPVQEKVNLDGTPVRGRETNQRTQEELDTRLRDLEDRHMCGICMEKPRDVAFLCGHGSCSVCAGNLDLCHMCRQPIEKKISLYLE
ncbi:E3 ubiquitin-protein ligase MIB2-like isoform X1 [Dermacentor variabilis]|uniref:E3 ubiquitin-protein ligase MIB2-like isoform X1 n=1 Tax=Dermacentor variabilis TaxID=34621 RepID=UPI003F5B6A2E